MTHAQVVVPGVAGWLWVDLGQRLARGTWARAPVADYWCGRCGVVVSAVGEWDVPRFVAGVRAAHRAECPGRAVAPDGAHAEINKLLTTTGSC